MVLGAEQHGCTYTDNLAGRDFSERMCVPPIDVVYTWVNGSEEGWLALKEQYRAAYLGLDVSEDVGTDAGADGDSDAFVAVNTSAFFNVTTDSNITSNAADAAPSPATENGVGSSTVTVTIRN